MRHLRDGELMVKFPIGAENMGPFPQPHFKFRSVRVVSAETTNYPVHLNALNAPWSLFVIAVAPYSTFVGTQVGKCFSKCFFFPSPSALLLFLSNLFRIFFLSQPRTGDFICIQTLNKARNRENTNFLFFVACNNNSKGGSATCCDN